MRYIVITTLAALVGFFACRTTTEPTQSALRDDVGAIAPASQTMSKPAAEALLTVLYGN
jgi:hypothetical protein